MTYRRAEMSQTQIEVFLQEVRFAIVGTNRVSGAPQLTPIWFLYENKRIYMSMGVDSVKYRNLRRDPRIGICISAPHPDARAVMIYGKADMIRADVAGYDDIHWRLTRRYYESDEEAQTFLDSLPTEDESVLVVVTPDRVLGEDYN